MPSPANFCTSSLASNQPSTQMLVTHREGNPVKPSKIVAAWHGNPECESCGMRHLALFADLTEDDFHRFHFHIDDLEFMAGTSIYTQADPGKAIYTVRVGLVQLIQHLSTGQTRIVRLLRSGDVLGLEATLGHGYQHSAIAMRNTLLCRIPAETIQKLASETPRLCQQLMRFWHRSVTQADDWLTKLSTGSTRIRMARLFLYLQEDDASPVCQFFGREEVASIIGVTTETASRTVAEFKRDGVITLLHANRFRCDVARLKEIALN